MDPTLASLRTALAGRYVVEQELGRGGMAVVYRAMDVQHDRVVAIKVMRSDIASPEAAERFVREIRTVAPWHHPHIVPLYDSGTAGEHRFYVMPYVDGESLRHRLERSGPLPIEEALRITREVADALEFAHERGVIHRDIKPENILLSGNHASVADFGIARAADAAGLRFTDTGLAIGTPAYMSPEQGTADPRMDGRADQYALACVLYEMLAGQPPFQATTGRAIMARHATDPVPPLTSVRQVPAALEAALVRALAKAPADRWPSTGEFAAAADRALADRMSAERWSSTGSGAHGHPSPVRRLAFLGAVLGVAATVTAIALWRPEGAGAVELSPMIAVLPFEFQGEASDAVYALAIQEYVHQGLATVEGIRLKSSAAIAPYRDSVADPQRLGRLLGADRVVTGRVYVADGRIKVFPEWIDVSTGTVVSGIGDSEGDIAAGDTIRDFFAVAQDAARGILRSMLPQLGAQRLSQVAGETRTRSADALRYYTLARRVSGDAIGARRSLALLDSALRIDSTFADAWALRAWRISGGGFPGSPADVIVAWKQSFDRALEYDPQNALALSERGFYYYTYEWDGARALVDLRRAVELNPALTEPTTNIALVFGHYNQLDSALHYAARGTRVDPNDAFAWNILGKVHAFRREIAQAVAASERSYALDSTMSHTNWVLANGLLDLGRQADASRAAERVRRFAERGEGGWGTYLMFLLRVGRHAEARELAQARIAEAKAAARPRFEDAYAYFVLGDTAATLDVLEAMVAQRSLETNSGLAREWTSRLRGHPRFDALLERVFRGQPSLVGPW